MTTLLRQVLYTVASVTKQYKLVSSKAGSGTGTPRDALAPSVDLQLQLVSG